MENIDLLDKNAWDDSALVRSWNQALKEYRKYHSIHAKGGRVEDALREEELLEDTVENHEQDAACKADDTTTTTKNEVEQSRQREACPIGQKYVLEKGTQDDPTEPTLTDRPEIPENLLGSHLEGDNKPLKNLMMSWYYAGYYTGFFEGQRAAQQQGGKEESTK